MTHSNDGSIERPASSGLPAARQGASRPASSRHRVERSAGGVVFRKLDDGLRVLLIRDPYRNWGLPKGHLEAGENSLEAAVREVREETGLDGIEVGPELGTIDWFFRLDGVLIHKFCTFFAMYSSSGQTEPEVAEGITECHWVPLDQGIQQISYENAREILVEADRRLKGGELDFETLR